MGKDNGRRLGWVGAGRMGQALAARLLAAGHDVAVYNRTRSKAEALVEAGGAIVDSPAPPAHPEVVFKMGARPPDLQQGVLGPPRGPARGRPGPPGVGAMTT